MNGLTSIGGRTTLGLLAGGSSNKGSSTMGAGGSKSCGVAAGSICFVESSFPPFLFPVDDALFFVAVGTAAAFVVGAGSVVTGAAGTFDEGIAVSSIGRPSMGLPVPSSVAGSSALG